MKTALLVLGGGVLLVGCADPGSGVPAATVQLEVRVLSTFLQPRKVCMDLAVSNGVHEVWAAGDPKITSFGADQTEVELELQDGALPPDRGAVCVNGVELATTIACDPDVDVSDAPGVQNELTFWIDELNADADGVEYGRRNWIDPCPDGCKVTFDCERASETTSPSLTVDIGLTNGISGQGFFDYGSAIDDAYCSGKVDSCIELLHDDALAQRVDTAVVGFACSTGGDAELRMDTLEVICDDLRFALPLAAGPHKTQAGAASLGYAAYFGTESIAPELSKSYVNHAIRVADLALLGGDCRLHFEATAVTDRDVLDAPADVTIYPVFNYDVALTKDGEATCDTLLINDHDTPAVYRGNVIGMTPLPAFCTKVVDGVPSNACQ